MKTIIYVQDFSLFESLANNAINKIEIPIDFQKTSIGQLTELSIAINSHIEKLGLPEIHKVMESTLRDWRDKLKNAKTHLDGKEKDELLFSCQTDKINSLVNFTTDGEIKTWLEYRSTNGSKMKEEKGSSSGNINLGDNQSGGQNINFLGNSGPIIFKSGEYLNELGEISYSDEDAKSEWMIYEVAFLWHEKEPPNIHSHFKLITRDIEKTKMALHQAVDEGLLEITRELRAANGVTRFVHRKELRKYAESINQRPLFLFPEDRK